MVKGVVGVVVAGVVAALTAAGVLGWIWVVLEESRPYPIRVPDDGV